MLLPRALFMRRASSRAALYSLCIPADVEQVELDFDYYVTNASWTSSYDFRVNSKRQTVDVQYYGSVSMLCVLMSCVSML